MMNHPVRVLLVEDNQGDAELIRAGFEEVDKSVEVHVRENGLEALKYLRGEGMQTGSKKPDLILLDLNMPGMSGLEFLQIIKSDSELHSLPIIILSTSDAKSDITKSYDHGANSYIVKPMNFDEYIEILSVTMKYWFQIGNLPGRICDAK